MPKPIAIVAAMRSELAPLLRGMSPRVVNGVDLWELPWALVAIGGIGASAASRAAEFAIAEARPELLVSAGFAGALRTELKAGEVVQVGEVVDAANGMRFLADHGNLVLVSSSGVVGTADKNRLAAEFGADIVDMEAAAVAQVAIKRGLSFAAIKAISDELEFTMPPVNQFVDAAGKFDTREFAAHIALRPRWWIPVLQLAAK